MQAYPQTNIDSITMQPMALDGWKYDPLDGPSFWQQPGYVFRCLFQGKMVSGSFRIIWDRAGYTIDQECRVIGWKHSITPDNWTITWHTIPTSAVPKSQRFHLGPHAQDRLDSGFQLGG